MFTRDVGLTPWGYVTDCRMDIAERLLAGSDLAIWEVASIVGYTTAQSFSRAYKRLRGCRPTDYQRQARAAQRTGPEPAPEAMVPMPVL